MSDPEICICAAIKLPSGEVIRGHRHDSCIDTILRRRSATRRDDLRDSVQGFVTSRNRFVNRHEGAILQRAAGVLSAHTGEEVKDTLFSEDLYFNGVDAVPSPAQGPTPNPKEK